MVEAMNPHELADEFLIELLALKGPSLLLVFLMMLGYGLKVFPWIDNKHIPLCIVLGGGMLSLLFIPLQPTKSIDPGLCCPEATQWASVLITGNLLGALAWLLHAKLLKKWIDEKVSKPDQPPTSPTP